jgi:hypothetical protein
VQEITSLMPEAAQKNPLRAFWDWFVLFSGISTASNLSRTRRDLVRRRGLFLFRSGKSDESRSSTQ